MTYELWDLASRNLIDFFEDRRDAVDAVQAYVDAGEADEVALLVHTGDGLEQAESLTGRQLVAWLQATRAGLQRTA